ncbi:MAG TPA: hypothetical protein VGM51_07705 [Armatimonadota bacterium]|jgi:hypothetical protein
MKNLSWLAAGLLVFALAPASLPAQGQTTTTADESAPKPVNIEDPITEVLQSLNGLPADVTDTDLAAVKATVEGLREKMGTMQRMIDVGAAPTGDLTDVKTRLSIAENALEKSRQLYGSSQRMKKLASPVDVQLKDATVEQTAQALSRGSGVSIRVDSSVPKKTRITLEARRVALSTVLEAIARQADLLIVPDGEGVLLQARPSLSVNGEDQIHSIRNWPWSSGWGALPPGAGGLSAFAMPYLGGPAVSKAPSFVESFLSAPKGSSADTGVAVTSVQDHIVVAEPGVNAKGEQGTWLTVYRLQGEDLVESSVTFHKAHGSTEGASITAKPAK